MIYPRCIAVRTCARFLSSLAIALLVFVPTSAWAVYPQKIELVGKGAEEIPTANIRFEANDGSVVMVKKDDDDGTIALIFPGDTPVPGSLILPLPDGSTARVAIPVAKPSEKIVLDLPRRSARAIPDRPGPNRSFPVKPSRSPSVTISVIGGVMDTQLPSVGAGTRVSGGTESFAALLDENVAIPFGGVGVSVGLGGGTLDLFGGYGEGNDRAISSIAAGGAVDVAITYTNRSPGNSTGIFLGNRGLDTMINRQADVLKFGGVYSLPLGEPNQSNGQINGRIGVEYKRVRQNIDASIISPSFGMNITANYRQRSRDANKSLILGAEYRQQSDSGFYFVFGADGMLIHRNASLNSVQNIVCTVCAASDRAFTITVTDSNNGITFGGRANAELGFAVSKTVSIGILGFAEYIDEVTQITNPRTGDDLFIRNQPTAIGTRSSRSFGGAVVLRIGL